MKIGILTFALKSNYGGIIQTFALKKVLEKLGYDVIVFEHVFTPKRFSLKTRYLIYLKRIILKYILRKDILIRNDRHALNVYLHLNSVIRKFIYKYIQEKYIKIKKDNFSSIDIMIVGSDQVWRPIYARPIEKFFLNFLDGNTKISKIAYAVSFGSYDWEFTQDEEKECARLAKQFDLITVREDSGVELCKKYLGVNATYVLDPTMLLEKDDYIKIVEKEHTKKSDGNLFAYILDNSSVKQKYINDIARLRKLKPFSIVLSPERYEKEIPLDGVDIWLRAFMDADFVVTDSFHGCVFSIIFNKPFIAIGNKERGQARFDSLLRLFNLKDRLVDINDLSLDIMQKNINWDDINRIKKQMQSKSLSLLIDKLKIKE